MCVLFWFFFFKQKTAYEMRISDWSSDVCSSDLDTLLPDITDAIRQLVCNTKFLGCESDFNPAVGDDFIGQMLAINTAQLRTRLDHRKQANAVARDVRKGAGEHRCAAKSGKFVEDDQHGNWRRFARQFPDI